jgi:hypothetical protein
MLQAPTDNLYKFVAIFGLIVFGFSAYVPLQRLEEHNREIAKWNAAWGPIVARARGLDDDSRDALDCAIAEAKKNAIEVVAKGCVQVEAHREQRKVAARDLARAMEELEGGKEMLGHLGLQFLIYRNIGFATGLLGLLMIFGGFRFWYFRVQKPLDAAIRRAATASVAGPTPEDDG